MVTISYAITACNEYAELEQLLYFLIYEIGEEDEIIVVVDETNIHKNVTELLYHFGKSEKDTNFNWYEHPLNKDFSKQKNFLNSKCNRDFIFQIDADETPHANLIDLLPQILEGNSDCEAYWVPRINTVDGLTKEHIKKWGWKVDEKGWVNFPDMQMRIYKKTIKILNGLNQFMNN